MNDSAYSLTEHLLLLSLSLLLCIKSVFVLCLSNESRQGMARQGKSAERSILVGADLKNDSVVFERWFS